MDCVITRIIFVMLSISVNFTISHNETAVCFRLLAYVTDNLSDIGTCYLVPVPMFFAVPQGILSIYSLIGGSVIFVLPAI